MLIDELKESPLVSVYKPVDIANQLWDGRFEPDQYLTWLTGCLGLAVCFNITPIEEMYVEKLLAQEETDNGMVPLLVSMEDYKPLPFEKTWFETKYKKRRSGVLINLNSARSYISAHFIIDGGLDQSGAEYVCFPYFINYGISQTGAPSTTISTNNYEGPLGALEIGDDWDQLLGIQFDKCMFALTLLACKNITHSPIPISEKLQKARVRKGKLPLTEFRYLKILVPGNRRAKGEATGGNDEQDLKRFHLVRGHFATYTSDSPRFGRLTDGVGTFWIPPHARGDKELGEIHKSYEIRPNKTKEASR